MSKLDFDILTFRFPIGKLPLNLDSIVLINRANNSITALDSFAPLIRSKSSSALCSPPLL